MPLNRYLIRNEYSLADRELYKAARKDDPEAVLEGVTMAGLVGVLRQLGDLAEFATEMFHGLHEEVMATAARRHGLMVRVQQIEAELPSVEKRLLSQTNHQAPLCNPGIDWHSKVHIDENMVTRRDFPRFVMDSYEECRGPPRLFLLDKFDVAGAGASLKRYSDPSFFRSESADSSYTTLDAQKEKKTRKTKRRGPRMRNGNTSEDSSSPHAKLHELLSEDIGSGNTDPDRRVKLKKRALDGFHCPEKSGQSYMQKFIDVSSPEHKHVHEISLDLVLMDPVSNATPKSGLEIVETDMIIPAEKDVEILSPSCVPDLVDKRSINELSEVTNGESAELSWKTHESDSDKILLLLAKELNDEDELAANSGRKSEGDEGESLSDYMSDADSFVDALATMESEFETDTESRARRDLHHLNRSKSTIDSDRSDEQEEFNNNPFTDVQSYGNSTISDDGSVLKQGREESLYSDTKSNIADSARDRDEEATQKSLEDLPPEQPSISVVVGIKKTREYVACNTLEIPDRTSCDKTELEESSPKSGKVENTFAKTELKWVKRLDEVSSEETLSSSLSGAEDPQIPDQYSPSSQTNCTIDDSMRYLFDQMSHNGSSVMLLKYASLDGSSVAEETPYSSRDQEKSGYINCKDENHIPYSQEKSQDTSHQLDLENKLEEAKDKISGEGDAGLPDQLDVSKVSLPCRGDVANISSISKAEDGHEMEETVTIYGEPALKTYPAIVGQDIEENTSFADEFETQTPTSETICLLEPICSGVTEAAEKHNTTEFMVTGSDEHSSSINGKAQSNSDAKESLGVILVEEAQSGLTNESIENRESCPTSYLDRSDSPLCKRSADEDPDDCHETIERDVYLDNEKEGIEEEKHSDATSDSPSKHSTGSAYVLEKEKYLDRIQTAVGEVCDKVVVTGAPDDAIEDGNANVVPLSSHLDHSPSLGPMKPHEEFSVEGSSQNDKENPWSPEYPEKMEAQKDGNHVDGIIVNSSSVLCGTISTSSSNNGSCTFLANDDQDNLCRSYLTEDKEEHLDATDTYDLTKPLVAMGESEETHAGKCLPEGSQALNPGQPVQANLSLDTESQPLEARTTVPSSSTSNQYQPLIAESIVETAGYNPEIEQDMGPSALAPPSVSVLPNQIEASQKFGVPRQPTDTSSGSPVLGVVSDTSETKQDEAPPLPPLPPMQWRLGKSQQNAFSMWQNLGPVQHAPPHQTGSNDLLGPQHWNPFSSFSNEDSEITNLSTQGKLANHEAAVQDEELHRISPAGQLVPNNPFDHISSLTEQETDNAFSQPASPLSMQHGFISPEDQQAWSRNAFFAVEPGSGNDNMQKKPPRPRNPLIEEVVALDKSKLRKVGERVKPQDGPRDEDMRQSLPKLRKVGERTKPKDSPASEQSEQGLLQLRKVGERNKPEDRTASEQLEQGLPQLRKVGEILKPADEAKLEGIEQSLLQEVAGRVEHRDEPKSEEKGESLPVLIGGSAGHLDELRAEERGQSIPQPQKIGQRVKLQVGSSPDNRDFLMEQIRNKTFNLKPTVTTRASIQGPQTNLKISAILEKATTIRQAMAGSDEDDSDGWSDN